MSSTPFGAAGGGSSPLGVPPAGVGVYFGFDITDNGTCLGCEIDLGFGTLSNFVQTYTAQNSPNFANFLTQATAGSDEPGHLVWAVLWTTNDAGGNIPSGAPVFINQSAPLSSLPSSPEITEVELVIDLYCVASQCTLPGSPETYQHILLGTLNLYADTRAVPEPGTMALLALGIAGVCASRRRSPGTIRRAGEPAADLSSR